MSEATAGTRMCPHCAEIVKADAVVCEHCGRDLGDKLRRNPGVTVSAIGIGLVALSCTLAYLLGITDRNSIMNLCWGVGVLVFLGGILMRLIATMDHEDNAI
jgi:hypothetical protein